MKIIIRIALLAILIPAMTYGGDKHNHEGTEIAVGVEALSRELRDLLSAEMIALQNGMMSIIPAYNSGNWGEIVTTAGQIKNSYSA